MRSIIKLMLANIRHGKGAFKGMILLMMLLTFSFSGTVSNNDRINESVEEKFAQAGIPDVIVTVYDDLLTDDMMTSVNEDKNVSECKVIQSMFFTEAPVSDSTEIEIRLMLARTDDDIRVFNDKLSGYVSDNSLAPGEMLVPSKLSLIDGFEKGAKLSLRTRDGYDETFTVKGYYEDIIHGATTVGDNYCIICDEDFDRLLENKTDHLMSTERYVILIDELYITGSGVSQTELRRELAQNSDLISSSNSAFTRDMLKDSIGMYSSIGTRTVGIFVALLLIVILISMHNSISASIELDRTELGILKSQGFTAGRISLVYVMQYVLALVIGAVLGILVSIPACSFLISKFMLLTGILSKTYVSFAKCAALSIGIILICTVFIFISTAKISHISPVSAISGGKGDVYFESRLNTRIRKPLPLFLALRQINSNRKSYIGTVCITAMLVFFISSIMILAQGLDIDNMFTGVSGEISLSDKGAFTLDDAAKLEAKVRETDSGASVECELGHYMTLDDEYIRVKSYRSAEDPIDPLEGRVPKYDNEIMITKFVSELIGKKTGETITVCCNDKKEEYVITGYFQTVMEFGMAGLMTPEGMERAGDNEIRSAFIKLSDMSKQQQVMDMVTSEYDTLTAEDFSENGTVKIYKSVVKVVMNSLSYSMYAVLLIFAAVIVNMMCKRIFIRERTDIGIFKATGFTADGLRMQFAVRFAVIAVIGSAAGCIAGLLCSRKVISYVLSVVGLSDFTSQNSISIFLMPAVLVSICFFITAYISSHRVKSVNVRELVTE
ncbi:MAG: FtsX-like permease family protein [Oscillospiraceae bacterium]|nr:FtsX-like permease family protein [Oscillospiraceae bacterium]